MAFITGDEVFSVMDGTTTLQLWQRIEQRHYFALITKKDEVLIPVTFQSYISTVQNSKGA